MKLLEVYKEKNENKRWFINHFSLGEGANGNMFEYIGTNSRILDSFMHQFSRFLEIENKPRNTWPRQPDHGQEIHKQYVVNMLQSKLFKKSADGLYSRTAKGIFYGHFIDSDTTKDEGWLINYLFLLNGYYFNRKNYIIYRVKKNLLGYLLSVDGVTEDLLVKEAIVLLRLNKSPFSTILRSDFFYIHSFYNDSDFLINYFRSSKAEKEELAKYIENNIKTKSFECCISQKYQPGGNFNKNMLIDETKTFLLTLLFLQSENVNLTNIYEVFIKNFNENIHKLNEKAVLKYLLSNKEIFDPIFEEILEIEEVDMEIPEEAPTEIIELPRVDVPEDYIDETKEGGKQKIKAIYIIRKKQARIQSNYKCTLEKINNCRLIYFTAKANNKNYIELHHLIPKEFRNDFSYSVEVLANYITLCPRCHRQIHFAVDREKKHLINALYDERKRRLELVGLKLELDELYKYYKIGP